MGRRNVKVEDGNVTEWRNISLHLNASRLVNRRHLPPSKDLMCQVMKSAPTKVTKRESTVAAGDM